MLFFLMREAMLGQSDAVSVPTISRQPTLLIVVGADGEVARY